MSPNVFAYCTEKVALPGSSLHYALVFQPDESKAFWLGCFTLAHEIRTTSMKQLEAGLTQVKLGWWRNALVAAKNANTVAHPIIEAIGPKHIHAVQEEAWTDLINQIAESTEVKRFNTLADWHATTLRELEPWGALIASKAKLSNTETLHTLMSFWGYSIELCQLLRLAKYLEQGFQPVPVDWLQKYGVTAEQIRNREHNDQVESLFVDLNQALRNQAEQTWKSLPKEVRLSVRPLRALYRMRVAELMQHKKSGFRLLTEEKPLTPLKKFTVSWTTQVLRF